MFLVVALESLFSLKEYRTPQGFRSFARAYILFLGVFYGDTRQCAYLHSATSTALSLATLVVMMPCLPECYLDSRPYYVVACSGPYYVYLGKTTTVDVDTGIKSYHENLQNSLVFACLVQIVLSGLYTIMQDLEDPFAKPGEQADHACSSFSATLQLCSELDAYI